MMMAILSAGACSSRSSSVDGVEVMSRLTQWFEIDPRNPLIVSRRLRGGQNDTGWLSLPSGIEIANDHAEHLRGRPRVACQDDHVVGGRAGRVEELAVADRNRREPCAAAANQAGTLDRG